METEQHNMARVKAQIEAVRDSGLTNMLDRYAVQRIANDHNFYDLVVFCEDNHAFAEAIFKGIHVPEDHPDANYAVKSIRNDPDDDPYNELSDESDAFCAWCHHRIADIDGAMWTGRGEMHEDCFQQYTDDQNTTSHW